jgi:hypothetical protein
MTEIDPAVLLSKEFGEASVRLAELREKQQKITEDFHKVYSAFNEQIALLESEAKEIWASLTEPSDEVEAQSTQVEEKEEVAEEE